jgi:hypothetical protein
VDDPQSVVGKLYADDLEYSPAWTTTWRTWT